MAEGVKMEYAYIGFVTSLVSTAIIQILWTWSINAAGRRVSLLVSFGHHFIYFIYASTVQTL